MTFQEEFVAACAAFPHADDCGIWDELAYARRCSCSREARLLAHVATVIEEALNVPYWEDQEFTVLQLLKKGPQP